MESGRMKKWALIILPAIILLAFVPAIIRWAAGFADDPGRIEELLDPMYFFALAATGGVLFYAFRAFRERSLFKWGAIASFIAGVIFVMSVDFIFHDVLQDHQRKRIEVLLGLKEDPTGVGYNVNQSMIAIGSGGLAGKGFLHGTQTTYGFVPEQSTDFIFCTIGEEWGFIGTTVVIILYVFLIWRIIHDAERSKEAFTRIYGYCVACCIFMHLFINIGMTIGIVPVIGIPLPLLSYGGSSLWAFTALIFIFIALDRNEKRFM
ncbi:MAG: rod shape-determining protein RodA [Bacteroidetes bacterium]|uniref:Cell wall polymerase n=1 Tax=Candidatus Cryptobacteroides excrementipullorum TaxID=2840761 RepID=A0A9D9IUR2_9BACT|nr:rod shape-determining protein RodA [Candidatus Cryptobacteroides excrementipullorum]